jgi:penicillin-binding protein 1A
MPVAAHPLRIETPMAVPASPRPPRPPVHASSDFVGRGDILTEILRLLADGETAGVLLVGPRRIGKTSLLRNLARRLETDDGFLPVYLDPGSAGPGPAPAVLRRLFRRLARELGMPDLAETNPDPDGFPAELGRRISFRAESPASTGRPILLLDEPAPGDGRDGARAAREIHRGFLRFLRAAGPRIAAVVAAGNRADDLENLGNDLPERFPAVRIGCLTAPETERLVRGSEGKTGLVWTDAGIAAILDQTGGHPYFVHLLCRAVREGNRARATDDPAPAATTEIAAEDIRSALPRTFSEVDPALNALWRGLGPAERAVAAILAADGGCDSEDQLSERLRTRGLYHPNGDLSGALDRLERWTLLRRRNGGFQMDARIVRDWIADRKPPGTVRTELVRMADELVRVAVLRHGEKQWTPAERLLRRALALTPAHREATLTLARVLLATGRPGEAVRALDPLRESDLPALKPLYAEALVARAADMDRDEDARLVLYETALEMDPESEAARRGRAEILEARAHRALEAGKTEAALGLFRDAGLPEKAREIEAALPRTAEVRKRRSPRWRKALIRMGCASAALALLVALAAGGLYAGYRHLSEDLPRIETLTDYRPPEVTAVYAADGRPIGEFYRERRYVIPLSAMPPHLIHAFIATEDARYFSHEGFDPIGIVRAFLKNIEAGSIVQGGSTITQQVVKSFLLTPERSYRRKFREAILAYRIDRAFSKEDILFLYLNQIFLGEGSYGVEGAARTYFDKSAADLSLAESALLAGLARAPSRDSPVRDPDRALARRDFVLERMRIEGHITPADEAEAKTRPARLAPRRNIFREETPFFTEHVRRELARTYGNRALYTGGLKVFTTVDPDLQRAARDAVREGLDALEGRRRYPEGLRPEGALVCLEPGTGRVRALIGGRDFNGSQFNRAVQARRQPGSAFKPVIYAAALDAGFTPMTLLQDAPFALPDNGELWRPSNYDGRFEGPVRLRMALARSRNVPAVRVMQSIGIDYTIDYARKLGIQSRLNRGLSLALGASGVTLLELTNAYGVFANGGMRVPPVFIERVEDRDGNVIFPTPDDPERAAGREPGHPPDPPDPSKPQDPSPNRRSIRKPPFS